ncbi:MAG: EAL domain-containing protein [Pseudobutyrivibrio sp.]|nr:EAL domain-containing protein [Pseudobutyrivibrio sp.]
MGKSVWVLNLIIIPPLLGNTIVIASTTMWLSSIGYYIYHIGMTLIMFALIGFTYNYCSIYNHSVRGFHIVSRILYGLLIIDMVQILANVKLGNAFKLQEIDAYGKPYFALIPHLGMTFHRLICYNCVLLVTFVFLYMSFIVPKIYKERYVVILISLILGTLWRTIYVFSRAPIDRSMIGFAVCDFLIFYFSIYYKPVRLLDSMLANLVSDMDASVFLFDLDGKCIWINEPGKRLVNVEDGDFEYATDFFKDKIHDIENIPEKENIDFTIEGENEDKYYTIEKSRFEDEAGKLQGSYLVVRDVSDEKHKIEDEIYSYNHDMLTGVYTKEYLLQKVAERVEGCNRDEYYIAFLDVRDFKIVNDIFGRSFGDYALCTIADWIRQHAGRNSIYGRMGGDSFGILLTKDEVKVEVLENDLANFVIKRQDTEYHLVIHMGFCELDEDVNDVSIFFDRAHLAISAIKYEYKQHLAFYDGSMREKVRYSQEISAQLSTAIRENQIIPYLQPIVDVNGKIVGAEALARWIHPVQGFMNPGSFIPTFEENGMIVDVDKHIWEYACKILDSWKIIHPDMFISVNISPKDFFLTDVLTDIKTFVKKYDINPRNLRIEVTETSMMSNIDGRMKMLEDFRKNNFIVEMDDFGSGYSSLNMLKDMPVDVLKIDMKFLGKTDDQEKANKIVKNIICLSDDLGIMSLTEGVETKEQFEMLKEMGCLLFQGYYFSKPLPLDEFEAMIAK